MAEVRIPKGISPASSVLARSSAIIVKPPPSNMAAGMDFSALAPNIRRDIWGTIRPTQLITPLIAVIAAAAATIVINKINRSRVNEAPNEKAVSSFKDNKFTRQRIT